MGMGLQHILFQVVENVSYLYGFLSVTMTTGSLKLCVDDNPMWTLKVTHNFFSAGKLHFKVSVPVFVLTVLQCIVYYKCYCILSIEGMVTYCVLIVLYVIFCLSKVW